MNTKKKGLTSFLSTLHGAGDRTRTGTVLPPVDFESTTSTNSITPACEIATDYTTGSRSWQEFFCGKLQISRRKKRISVVS